MPAPQLAQERNKIMHSNFMNGFADEFYKLSAVQPGQSTSYVGDAAPKKSGPNPNLGKVTGKLNIPSGAPSATNQTTSTPPAVAAAKPQKAKRDFNKNPTPWQTALRTAKKAGGTAKADLLAKGKDAWKAQRGQAQTAAAVNKGKTPKLTTTGPLGKAPMPGGGGPQTPAAPKRDPRRSSPEFNASRGTAAGRRNAGPRRAAMSQARMEKSQLTRANVATGSGGATAQPKRSAAVAKFDIPKKPASGMVAGISRAAKSLNPFS